MKFTSFLKKNKSPSTNNFKDNGMSFQNNKNQKSFIFYLIPIAISNLLTFLLAMGMNSPQETIFPLAHLNNYAQVILPLKLTTPFAPYKQILLVNKAQTKTYQNIFFIKKIEASDHSLMPQENSHSLFVLYAPIENISELSNSSLLTALPWNTKSPPQKIATKKRTSHEIIY